MLKKAKVLVTGHDLKFWRPLQHELESTGMFEFREDEWSGHNEHNPEQTLAGIQWADIIVAEWLLGNAVFCSKHKRPQQRLITRLHLQERGTEFPSLVDYNAIDLIVFVGEHVQNECVRKFSMPREKTCVIGNFLDVKRFNLPKLSGHELNIGLIGAAPSRKRLDLAVDTLELLLQLDPRYSLHVKGPSPQTYSWLWGRKNERHYYEEVYRRINGDERLRYRVIFDPPGNDVEFWLRKIGYILSPSDFESFHMAVAEGMSSGAAPIVWKWEGAQKIYPPVELVDSPARAAKIIDLLRRSNTRPRLAEQSRKFIEANYDSAIVKNRWIDALMGRSGGQKLAIPKSNKKKSVLIIYSIDKWETFHRREMLEAVAAELSESFDLLVIEPGSHYETLRSENICTEQELNSYAQLVPVRVGENIYKLHILQGRLPAQVKSHPELRGARNRSEAIAVAANEIFGKGRNLIHWIYKPNQRSIVPINEPYVYEVYDEYTKDFGSGSPIEEMVKLEPPVLKEASHVVFTSTPLADRKSGHCRKWSVIGNGVSFEAFSRYHVEEKQITSLRKSVGYLGNLSDFFDWHLMVEVVKSLPEIDFFFHGQVEYNRLEHLQKEIKALMDLPNAYFSGRVSRPIGAAAVNRYDTLIIPFVVNDAMHAVNPLKLWEYLATGSSVVMSKMNAVNFTLPGLRIATTTEEWVDAIKKAISESESDRELRRDAAEANAWPSIAKRYAEVIYSVA